MKKLIYYCVILIFCCYACKQKSDEATPDKGGSNSDKDIRSSTPCSFNISEVAANTTLSIDCLLDLKGETIVLPQSVSFEFAGGDIINGTLKFSGGQIDGRLLSSKLTIEGDVQLKNPVFELIPSRWDIVEGTTTSDIALKNTATLEDLMLFTKKLGATTFKIDQLDAYFEVTKITSTATNANYYPTLEAVNLPSDFNLIMTDNTHLRIFPGEAGTKNGAILSIHDAENITVTGGIFHGDRDQRAYSPSDDGSEGSHLFYIRSGRNIVLDGLRFEEGSKGALAINSLGFSFNPATYKPTKDVTVKNCTFKDMRRMSIALTDGRNINIEGNTFINSGMPSRNSDGGEVGYAINIEAARTRDANGNLKEYEKAIDITIKGNKETGSRGGCVTVTIGQNVTVEDNDFETQLVYSLTSGTKIRNNTFVASAKSAERFAIFGGGVGETVFNNEISGNTITGYSSGIITSTRDVSVYNNTINDCKVGIQISKTLKGKFYNNKISASNHGISATNTFNNDVEVRENEVMAGKFHVYFANLNNKTEYQDYKIILEKNKFLNSNKKVSFSNARGITFKNNEVVGGIEIGNTFQTEISFNVIKPSESDGIRLYNAHSAVTIMSNTISDPTGAARYQCINNKSDSPQEVSMTGNTCN